MVKTLEIGLSISRNRNLSRFREIWRFMKSIILLIAILSVSIATQAQQTAQTQTLNEFAQSKRPFAVEDLLKIETIGKTQISPDGDLIAVEIMRSLINHRFYWDNQLDGKDRSDIFFLSVEKNELRQITFGNKDGTGSWFSSWSPKGNFLAFLQSDGENVRLKVWNRKQNKANYLSKRGVELRLNALGEPFPFRPYRWLDDEHLLTTLLPANEVSSYYNYGIRSQREASRLWKNATEGKIPTSIILKNPLDEENVASKVLGEFVMINVVNGKITKLLDNNVKNLLVSPDGKYLAVLAEIPGRSGESGKSLNQRRTMTRFGIIETKSPFRIRWFDEIGKPEINFDIFDHRWSPNGKYLIVKGLNKENKPTLFQIEILNGTVKEISPASLTVQQAIWTPENQILIYGTSVTDKRPHWWLENSEKVWKNLTENMENVPSNLFLENESLMGLSGGKLWSFKEKGFFPLTIPNATNLGNIAWLPQEQRYGIITDGIVIRTQKENALEYFYLKSQKIQQLLSTSSGVSLVNYSPKHNLAIYHGNREDGQYLWISKNGKPLEKRIHLNSYLKEVEEGEKQFIEYQHPNGNKYNALLVLPPNYRKGTRLPLIVIPYGGDIIRNKFFYDKHSPYTGNTQLIVSQGYAVLVPSIPLSTGPSDPFLDIPKGVMPAVDRAIELGFADANRLGLFGHSYGGYSVNSLISQSNRFKVAISSAGITNLTSIYGTFDARDRYSPTDFQFPPGIRNNENGQFRMGGTPWDEADRYVRNSPISFVKQIETPLLLIHGDIDFVPIQQSEELFLSLARLNKPVQLIRYSGEGHFPTSPANVRDVWKHIFIWLEKYIGNPQKQKGVGNLN
jgi:dipeptidyl aminopeptidase/acylaminoacyl peptidase